ncbi:MAG TPA: hypothetical protein VFX59_13665 [Polyangiales bacterium]|nr:hypothetical protein [Polyangiales bacterium]
MKLRWLCLVLICACAPASWQVRTLPPCYQALEDPTQERERAQLTAVLALQNRGYGVVQREGWIEASGPVRWRVRVTDSAGLDVDGERDTPQARARFEELQQSVAQVRCRPLDELRGEVQGRTAGGDATQTRLVLLHQQRDETRVGGPIALVAIGAGVAATGIGLITDALLWRAEGCDGDDCSLRDLARPFGIAGAAMVGVGAVVVGVSLPWMIRTIRKRSALNREIKSLRDGQLSFGPTGVQLRASF